MPKHAGENKLDRTLSIRFRIANNRTVVVVAFLFGYHRQCSPNSDSAVGSIIAGADGSSIEKLLKRPSSKSVRRPNYF
jgi:hypothetical protein